MSQQHPTPTVSFRAAVLAGLAGPLLALVVGAGAVVAAETGPYVGDHGFVPPALTR